MSSGPEGLSSVETTERLRRYGPNRIEVEKEDPWWLLLARQLRDPLVYILLGAAALTLALQEYIDAGVILAVVALNTVIVFFQELRAQQIMRALARLSAPRADVVRDGRTRRVPSEELVPGDVVLLTSGSRVPADLRLLHGSTTVIASDKTETLTRNQMTVKSIWTSKGVFEVTGSGTISGAKSSWVRIRSRPPMNSPSGRRCAPECWRTKPILTCWTRTEARWGIRRRQPCSWQRPRGIWSREASSPSIPSSTSSPSSRSAASWPPSIEATAMDLTGYT